MANLDVDRHVVVHLTCKDGSNETDLVHVNAAVDVARV